MRYADTAIYCSNNFNRRNVDTTKIFRFVVLDEFMDYWLNFVVITYKLLC